VSWLDSLALWSVRGEAVQSPVRPPPPPSDGGPGISRRTALRSAGAAALLSGPLSFLAPGQARADTLGQCVSASDKRAYDDFQACVKNPLEAFDVYRRAIATAEDSLRHATGDRRRRLLGIIDRSSKGLERAVTKLEDCNAAWFADRYKGIAGCYAANSPGGGGGGVNSPPSTKCDPNLEIQCGNICCNATGHPECCFCGKTGMYQCCASGSNCMCGGC
jgi:hypothetical protein